MWLRDIELESENIKLIPLRQEHAQALVSAAEDGKLWDLWFTIVPNQDSVNNYISQALQQKEQGLALPFVVVDKATDSIIGTTRFCNADPANQRLEIGYTWYSQTHQKTGCNTQCKLLLLTHAFETLNAIAVEFRTGFHNQASKQAISRLGAKQDGILRNHRKLENGGYRDTVVFSIINSEWLAVKAHLKHKLSKYRH